MIFQNGISKERTKPEKLPLKLLFILSKAMVLAFLLAKLKQTKMLIHLMSYLNFVKRDLEKLCDNATIIEFVTFYCRL